MGIADELLIKAQRAQIEELDSLLAEARALHQQALADAKREGFREGLERIKNFPHLPQCDGDECECDEDIDSLRERLNYHSIDAIIQKVEGL